MQWNLFTSSVQILYIFIELIDRFFCIKNFTIQANLFSVPKKLLKSIKKEFYFIFVFFSTYKKQIH